MFMIVTEWSDGSSSRCRVGTLTEADEVLDVRKAELENWLATSAERQSCPVRVSAYDDWTNSDAWEWTAVEWAYRLGKRDAQDARRDRIRSMQLPEFREVVTS